MLFTEVIPRWIWAVVIAAAIVLAGLIMVGTVVRYVAEAALIRMVNATEAARGGRSTRRASSETETHRNSQCSQTRGPQCDDAWGVRMSTDG